MTKKTTSKRQKFYLTDTPIRKLKTGVRVHKSKSISHLRNKELIFHALWECLVDKDIDSFKEILRSHLEAVNKEQFAKKAKTSKRTLHRILSKKGNPTLKNISNVIHALYG